MRSYGRELLLFFVLATLGSLAFINALPNSFHFDDYPTIVQNGAIRTFQFLPSYFTDTSTWTISRLRDWRPIVLTTFALNYWMGGLNPIVFRGTNLLLHLGCAYLLLLIFRNIAARPAARLSHLSPQAIRRIGLIAAIVFLVHTANSEVVNYIFARSTLLASFFYVLAFYAYLRGPLRDGGAGSAVWTVVGLSAYILGVCSKGSAVPLPLAILVFEILFLNPSARPIWRLFFTEPGRLKKYLPLALVFVGYVIVRQSLAPLVLSALIRRSGRVQPYAYLLTQFRAWVYYLGLFFWPANLLTDFTSFGWSRSLWDLRVLAALGIIAPIVGAGLWLKSRSPVISFFIFWYFIALLPEASIVPLSDAVNGYRFYPSNIGLVIIIVLVFFQLTLWLAGKIKTGETGQRRGLTAASCLAAAMICVLIVSTWMRNEVFRDGGTFWSDVLKKDPGNMRAHLGLGSFLLDEKKYSEALPLFEKAIELSPGNAFGYMFRGHLYALLDRHEDAISDYDRAVKRDRHDSFIFVLRGDSHKALGEHEKALEDYDRALRLRPLYAEAHLARSAVLDALGKLPEALEACKWGQQIDPQEPDFYLCQGRLLGKQNRHAEALAVYETATKRGLETAELWYELGREYDRENRHAQAAEAYYQSTRLLGRVEEKPKLNFFPTLEEN
jgi:protein O-mannosyl-transferase